MNTEGMRSLGAAESTMRRFSDRSERRGQSWRKKGLLAITWALAASFEGTLSRYASAVRQLEMPEVEKRIRSGVGYITQAITRGFTFKQAHPPMRDVGKSS
ncbi:MAG: UPF0236 family transposase-like protein [Bacillota bacterium]